MFRKFLFFMVFTAAVVTSSLFAQEKNDTDSTSRFATEKDTDSTGSNEGEDEEWAFGWSDGWHHNDWGHFDVKGQPTIEATYGASVIGIKSLSGKIADAGAAELKLSYSSLREREGYIATYKNNFAFVSTNSMDLKQQSAGVTGFTSETWRFGLGYQQAYAYKFGNAAIIPYTSNAFAWTRFEVKSGSTDLLLSSANPEPESVVLAALKDAETLDNFNQTFRFGQLTEGGIKLQVVPVLTFNAGYERAIVFPRHMFWKHAGSMLIEAVGLGAIDTFVREILDSSPAAGPIVNFALKNGFSYALYQLRKEKMNWPFDTAEPLTYDTWKIGMTFTF